MPTHTPPLNNASHVSQLIDINKANTKNAGNKNGFIFFIFNSLNFDTTYFKPNFINAKIVQ